MKKCAKCGYENLDEALFCAECGHELSSSSSNSNPRRNISFKQIKNNFKRHPYLHICCLFHPSSSTSTYAMESAPAVASAI